MSLFVTEDDEYDGKENPDDGPLPDTEISVGRTVAHYNKLHEESLPIEFEEGTTAIPQFELRNINCNLPLRYLQEIVETMLTKDGLLILGRGLGCETISANLLYTLSAPTVLIEEGPKRKSSKKSLVLLLGAKEAELKTLSDALMEIQWMNEAVEKLLPAVDASEWLLPLTVVGGSDLANTVKRKNIYKAGGIVAISSQVLIVDLLSGIVKPDEITGIFVMHAEKVRETSNDLFIINLYRDQNSWGFVKAVSDQPEAFTGFTPLATRLRLLRLPGVFLWPRFHVEILSLLLLKTKKARATVTEVNVGLSPKMAKIQTAILSCLQACLQELSRHNLTIDSEYWDMENVHDQDFVVRVRLSLELQWHRISWTSKQLVFDLATLKDLLTSLPADDSLTYYQKVQGIVDANTRLLSLSAGTMGHTSMSPWLMMDEATTIVAYAKERALGKVTVIPRGNAPENGNDDESEDASTDKNSDPIFVYNLEELPKWEQLAMIIDDVMHERTFEKVDGPVLVMCLAPSIAQQLSSVLSSARKREFDGRRSFSFRPYMVSGLGSYLSWQNLTNFSKKLNTEFAEADEDGPPELHELKTSKTFRRDKTAPPASKRRRTRGAAAVANVARLYSGSDFQRSAGAVDLEDEIVERLNKQVKEEEISDDDDLEFLGETKNDDSVLDRGEAETSPDLEGNDSFEHVERFSQVIIHCYDDTDEYLLQELAPSYIIMYEPNLAFIRRVELFQALNPVSPAKVFFMYYGTSVEEQRHLMQIKREKSAFTKLIREKAALGKLFVSESDNWKFRIRKPQVANTRIAGGANFRTENDEMRVIVDTREFRSSLPNLLYRAGIQVVPCMLTVGDYVVSPRIVVERKAIPDLISSFKSGRLYQQCEQMFRNYEIATLLIEFDETKSFSFEPFAELRPPGQKTDTMTNFSSKISKKEIQLKITELLVSFPKLKIVWSSSPYETAQIFLELKANQPEPDVEEALSKGVNSTITTSDGPPMFNDDAIDFLQSIPGITSSNYTQLIQHVRNMAELVCLDRNQFKSILGEENGNRAYNFINHRVE